MIGKALIENRVINRLEKDRADCIFPASNNPRQFQCGIRLLQLLACRGLQKFSINRKMNIITRRGFVCLIHPNSIPMWRFQWKMFLLLAC
jgi:hypothetical protein